MEMTDHALPSVKKITLLVIGLIVTLGMIGYFYQYTVGSRASSDATVSFFFPKSSVDTSISESFTVDIQALSTNPVSIATILVNYPRDIIAFDEAKTNADFSGCQELETAIDIRVIESSSQNTNTIVITRGSFKSDAELPKNIFCAGRLLFTGIKEGSGTITFVPVEGSIGTWKWDVAGPGAVLSSVLSGESQQMTVTVNTRTVTTPQVSISPQPSTTTSPAPTSTQSTDSRSLSIAPGETSITMKVRLQGITQEPQDSTEIPIQVTLVKNQSTVDIRTIPFSPLSDGTYQATFKYQGISMTDGYSFLLKGPKHLQKRICDRTPREQVEGTYECEGSNIIFTPGENILDVSGVLLIAGDTPYQNGVVDSVDIGFIRSNMGERSQEVVARGDLNYDGVVDTQDYTLIINSLKYKYDE